MEWLWAAQISVDLVLISFGIYLWLERRSSAKAKVETQLKELLLRMDYQSGEVTKRTEAAREHTDNYLRQLQLICERAHQILLKGKTQIEQHIPSLEEEQLREALERGMDSIPTVSEAESSRASGPLRQLLNATESGL